MANSCPPISNETLWRDTESKRVYGAILYGFSISFYALCCFLFWLGKSFYKFERFDNRPYIAVFFVLIGCVSQAQVDPLTMVIGGENFPCWATVFFSINIVSFVGGAIVGRLAIFYFRTRFEAKAMEDFKAKQEGFNPGADEFGEDHPALDRNMKLRALREGGRHFFFFGKGDTNLRSLRFLGSSSVVSTCTLVFTIPSLIVCLILILSDSKYLNNCRGCGASLEAAIFIIVQGFFLVITLALALFRIVLVDKIPDQWGFLLEMHCCVFFGFVALVGYALTIFGNDNFPVFDYTFILSIGVWGEMTSTTILPLCMALYYHEPSRLSRRYKSNKVESSQHLSTSFVKITLAQILANPALSQLFEEQLSREFAIESLLFYKEADKWRAMYNDLGVATRKARAKHIVKVYVRHNGILPVNLPSAISKELVHVVDQGVDPPYDLFDDALAEVRHLLEKGAVMRFRTTHDAKLVAM